MSATHFAAFADPYSRRIVLTISSGSDPAATLRLPPEDALRLADLIRTVANLLPPPEVN